MWQPRATDVRWEWIGEAWKLFAAQAMTWSLMMVIFVIAIIIPFLPIVFTLSAAGIFASDWQRGDWGALLAGLGLTLLLLVAAVIVIIPLSVWLMGGLYRAAIRQLRGEAISPGDIFSGGDCFARLLGAVLLLLLARIVVSAIIGIPSRILHQLGPLTSLLSSVAGMVITGLTFYTGPLIVGARAGVIEAISASVEATKAHLPMYTLFALVVGILSYIGLVACCVGIVVTGPLYFLITAVAYRDAFGLPGAQRAGQLRDPYAPPPPPPNYGAAPRTKFCHNCGAEAPAVSSFCPRCGSTLPA
ncbi:MAG TPA: zinc-ribbon domain-containing protein [Blastocatellia bacterium]|nr:zinc-ribbon domain-containing protein [Blastocatellia bacterium]